MTKVIGQKKKDPLMPWWVWPFYLPLVPFLLIGFTVFLGPLAVLSIIYFTVFPERHAHIYDFEGSERQKLLLAKWRSKYRTLTIRQRIGRGYAMWCRQLRRSKLPHPRHENRMIREASERSLNHIQTQQQMH